MMKQKLAWTHLLVFLFVFLASQVIVIQLLEILDILFESSLTKTFSIGYVWLILEGVIFVLMFIFSKRIRYFIIEALNLSVLNSFRTYIYVFIGFMIYLFFQYLFISILQIGDPSDKPKELGLSGQLDLFQQCLFILSIGIITPIKEELIFRGIIHRFFEVKYTFWIGLVVSAGVFGSLHFGYAILASFMGAGFVLLYKITNSLAAPILLHITWNLFGVFILLYT